MSIKKPENIIKITDEDAYAEEFYIDLVKSCSKHVKAKDIKLIRKAYDLAKELHKGIKRKSGEPYILHPIAVAKIVTSEIGLGTTSIICALLHDVVEDTEYTLEDLRLLITGNAKNIAVTKPLTDNTESILRYRRHK